MNVEVFLRNKLERQIKWNGQPFKFIRHKRNDFHEITDEVEKEFNFNGVFHEGGGYGGTGAVHPGPRHSLRGADAPGLSG